MRIENSFILAPGIGNKTEKRLWKNKVTHWDHIDETDILTSSKKQKLQKFIKKARKNLEVENTHFFKDKLPNKHHWRMYENFQKNACFFDIETTGLDKKKNKVTTVSFHRNGETQTLVQGKNLTQENLKQQFFESSIILTFNGKRFDKPFLEHNFDIEIENPHIDLMYECRKIGLSGGLKEIEKQLNIQRDLEDIDGKEAVKLWKKYEKTGNEKYLNKLVKYCEYDAKNLQKLTEMILDKVEEKHFRRYCPH